MSLGVAARVPPARWASPPAGVTTSRRAAPSVGAAHRDGYRSMPAGGAKAAPATLAVPAIGTVDAPPAADAFPHLVHTRCTLADHAGAPRARVRPCAAAVTVAPRASSVRRSQQPPVLQRATGGTREPH